MRHTCATLMGFFFAAIFGAVVVGSVGAGCASTASEPPSSTRAIADEGPGVPPPPAASVSATSAAAPPTSAAAPPPAATGVVRSADGIDDQNWLPKQGTPAYSAFMEAVETSRRDPAAAVARFVDAANKSTYFYAAWYNAGVAAEVVGDVAAAERHYRQALALRGDYGPALTNLSTLLSRSNKDAAQQLVRQALERAPERAGPHEAAASLAMAQGDLVVAEREALQAVKYDERSVPAMLIMGRVFRAQNRIDTARFALENALALEPGNALVHLELGHVLLLQGDDKAALVSFEKATRLRPSLAEAQESYGLQLLKLGFAPEAQRAFEAVVRLRPQSAVAYLNLGNALRATKAWPAAETAYKQALALDPGLHEVHFNLGVLYIDNALPGDELSRLKTGVAELKLFEAKGKPEVAVAKRVDDYVDSTEKRIQKEQKRREREERRKKEGDKEGAPPAAPPAGTPAPQKTPSPPGAAGG